MRHNLLLSSSPDDQLALEEFALALNETPDLDVQYADSRQTSPWTVAHTWLSLTSDEAITLVDDHALNSRHVVLEAATAERLNHLASELTVRVGIVTAQQAVALAEEHFTDTPGHLLRAALVASHDPTAAQRLATTLQRSLQHAQPNVRATSLQAATLAGLLPDPETLEAMRGTEADAEVQRLLDFVIRQTKPQ